MASATATASQAHAPRTSNLHVDVQVLEKTIEDLIAAYPDLADDEYLRADMLEGSTDINDVLERVLDRLIEANGDVAKATARVESLRGRMAAHERRVESMRKLALRIMTAANLRTAKLTEGTLSRVKGSESVSVTDEALLPAAYVKEKVSTAPDKTAIKAALQAGTAVPGAILVTSDETLQVR